MSTESIQFSLNERFAAPLREFYKRRIIFWYDEDREFEATLDELTFENVKIVKLTGTNNFAVKKLLTKDDLDGNYLLGNDCFDGMKLVDGKITLEDKPGLGLTKKPGIINL